MPNFDLIALLLTRCGMLMEDAAPVAILRAEPADVATQIAAVRQAATDVLSLAAAAGVLLGHSD